MKKYIAISFSTKNQSFNKIYIVLNAILKHFIGRAEEVILVNEFMPRDVAQARGISTTAIDSLKLFFPFQVSGYINGKLDRGYMVQLLKKHNGVAYIIGDIVGGVAEECALYESNGVKVIKLGLDFDGTFPEEDTAAPVIPVPSTTKDAEPPANHEQITAINELASILISQISSFRMQTKDGEQIAQYTLAIRRIQEGQMWAVSACELTVN